MPVNSTSPKFQSFIWAGYECTYALNQFYDRMDLLRDTKHDELIDWDYSLIKDIGITTVREGLSWNQIDGGNGNYDFSRFEPMLLAGKKNGIQQIWDLNHFDFPVAIDPFSSEFIDRFADYAKACIELVSQYQHDQIYIVPMNEISFFAWIGGKMGNWAPFQTGRENEIALKKQLVSASIVAQKAIWSINPEVRFIHADPVLNRRTKHNPTPQQKDAVEDFDQNVKYLAFDMLCGKEYPELGGAPEFLDIVGMNYYFHNQEWASESTENPNEPIKFEPIPWEHQDRILLREMIQDLHFRYQRPIVITETGTPGNLRPAWWQTILDEIVVAWDQGTPVYGVCAYPIVDCPEKSGFVAAKSGLWDFEEHDPDCWRIPHEPTLGIIRNFLKNFPAKIQSEINEIYHSKM